MMPMTTTRDPQRENHDQSLKWMLTKHPANRMMLAIEYAFKVFRLRLM